MVQVTQGYTTEEKCTNWPQQKCVLQKQKVKKYTPETECKKVPFELCGPAGCPVEPGQEQCQDKTETVSSMRLCHPPDGSTSPKYKLLCFITTKRICKVKNTLAFNRDRCCHLVLCLQLIPFHWVPSIDI